MRIKIKNKCKFVARILEFLIIIGTIIVTPKAIDYANAWRGYKGYGGEYLLPVMAFILIMIIESILDDLKGAERNGR